MKCYVFIFILVSSIIHCNLSGQESDQVSKLDAFFNHIENADKGMGSISIRVDGDPFYQRSIGYANLLNETPTDQHTIYRIGSISKTFTTVILQQLIEEELIGLDDKIDTYFPDFPNADQISIRHLVLHQSGLFNITSDPEFPNYMEQPQTRIELVERIGKLDPVFPPGSSADYSNSNFILLTFIIEDVTGQSFAESLQERICKPCALKDTYLDTREEQRSNKALSYVKTRSWIPSSDTDPSIPLGAGAIVSTANDLTSFFDCLFNENVVSNTSLERMKSVDKGFGMGLFIFPFNEKTSYGHTGGIDGFVSMASYFPDERVSIAYLANGVSMSVNDIVIGALSIYFNKPHTFPTFINPVEVSLEILEKYTGIYKSNVFPLDITISIEEGGLIAQATGQPSFNLDAISEVVFRFDMAGVEIEFDTAGKILKLRQAGGEYTFEKTNE